MNFDFILIKRLGHMKRAMENSFGSSTLGQKYMNIRTNMFGIGYVERMQRIVGYEKSITKGNLDELLENSKAKSTNIVKLF